MPIQYFYPTGDRLVSSTAQVIPPNVPKYSVVDEGTMTPNDNDYIYITSLGPGFPLTSISLNTDKPQVIPDNADTAYMNIRCRAQGSSGTYWQLSSPSCLGTDSSGVFALRYDVNNTNITNTNFQTLQIPLPLGLSGNVGRQYFLPFVSASMSVQLTCMGGNGISNFYLSAMEVIWSGDNVFEPNGSTNLYTQGPIPFSGALNNPTMYIDGPEPSSGTITLYITGVVPTGLADGIPLYTVGKAPASGGIDLYTQSLSANLNNDLFIAGHLPINTFTTLFTSGDFPHASMSLFMPGKVPVPSSGFATFYTYSTLNSGVFGSTNLSITSTNTAGSLPLYIKAKDGDNNQYLPLMVKCDNTGQNNTQLYIANNNQTVQSGINLRVNGAGQNAGWNTDNDSMYLFINRANDAVANNVGLYVEGPDGSFTSTPLMISGGYVVNNNMNLVVPNSIGPIHGNTSLYNHGH